MKRTRVLIWGHRRSGEVVAPQPLRKGVEFQERMGGCSEKQRKQLTLRSVRRKGKGKEVILTEHALCALDSAGHFHILYLI